MTNLNLLDINNFIFCVLYSNQFFIIIGKYNWKIYQYLINAYFDFFKLQVSPRVAYFVLTGFSRINLINHRLFFMQKILTVVVCILRSSVFPSLPY